MMATTNKLLKYLGRNDTASIARLHSGFYTDGLLTEKQIKEALTRILEDCKTYQRITKKYGVPKQSGYKIKDTFDGHKEIEIMLFNKKDTVFNMTYCKIVIAFYPFSIREPNLIYSYYLELGSDTPTNIKIVPIQSIKNN